MIKKIVTKFIMKDPEVIYIERSSKESKAWCQTDKKALLHAFLQSGF